MGYKTYMGRERATMKLGLQNSARFQAREKGKGQEQERAIRASELLKKRLSLIGEKASKTHG